MEYPILIQAGEDCFVNLNELLYITKAKTKQIYICVFKSKQNALVSVSQSQEGDNNILFLTPTQYKEFCSNLQFFYNRQNA